MSGLIDTTEMYLKTVYELFEEGVPALRARIVERLKQSGPTVSETVARMERDGLLAVGNNRQIRFTKEGWQLAQQVMRRHRLAERLLVDVIKVPLELVHDEACRWEHVISDAVAERIESVLNLPSFDPFGNPIPSVAEASLSALDSVESFESGNGVSPAPRVGLFSLSEDSDQLIVGKRYVLARIGESLQSEAGGIGDLVEFNLLPGAELEVVEINDSGVHISVAGEECLVSPDFGSKLFVKNL
ncbi:MAG: metal-dependent transcriptional regulator [Arcanobacterium sp.]|nr:metal-dependent transcriptional regulator [Arcanobacterium sp.]